METVASVRDYLFDKDCLLLFRKTHNSYITVRPLLDDRECVSGRCDSLFTCRPKLSDGSICVETSDCREGSSCPSGICGRACNHDSQCNGDEWCSWLTDVCKPLMPNGNGCIDDRECESGR